MSTLHYIEGQIISRDNRGSLVEWNDGSRERISKFVSWALSEKPKGFRFGARVDWNGKAVARILEITPL